MSDVTTSASSSSRESEIKSANFCICTDLVSPGTSYQGSRHTSSGYVIDRGGGGGGGGGDVHGNGLKGSSPRSSRRADSRDHLNHISRLGESADELRLGGGEGVVRVGDGDGVATGEFGGRGGRRGDRGDGSGDVGEAGNNRLG